MVSVSRKSVLDAVLVAAILLTAPQAIYRIFQTGDLYLFTDRFFHDVMARLSGPGRLRFVVQPIVAMVLGVRSGVQDARAGMPPFIWALVGHGPHRRQLLRTAFDSVRSLAAIAILLDMVAQFVIFRQVRPGAALVVGPVLISVPYILVRTLTRQFTSRSVRAQPHLTN